MDNRLLFASTTRGAACYVNLSYDIVRALLQFLALNPNAYETTPHEHQRAIACLVSAHRQRLGDLATYFRTIGLSKHPRAVDRLCRPLADVSQDTQPHVLTNESSLLSILADARVSGFERYGLILHVSDNDLGRYGPNVLVSKLKPLFAGVPDLVGARVVLKAGIPDLLMDPLEIKWSTTQLKALLQNQVDKSATRQKTESGHQEDGHRSLRWRRFQVTHMMRS